MGIEQLFLLAVETHSPARITEALAAGLDVHAPIDGRRPLRWMTEMYMRSARFSECVRTLVDAGADVDDPVLLAVLLDDPLALRDAIASEPERLMSRVDLVSAFTPLSGATLLHVAAEFGLTAAARELLDLGADPEASAAHDEQGFNGQSPIFHTVCALGNHGQPVLRLLLGRGARTDHRLVGITWGAGFEWATTLLDVTLLSYTQAGLLPQFQRSEEDIFANLRLICAASGHPLPRHPNVPNAYCRTAKSRREAGPADG